MLRTNRFSPPSKLTTLFSDSRLFHYPTIFTPLYHFFQRMKPFYPLSNEIKRHQIADLDADSFQTFSPSDRIPMLSNAVVSMHVLELLAFTVEMPKKIASVRRLGATFPLSPVACVSPFLSDC